MYLSSYDYDLLRESLIKLVACIVDSTWCVNALL